jgi:hypothetical protein
MLPSFWKRNSETDATRPFWSLQEMRRVAVTGWSGMALV